jgi:hypothetical protein
VRSAKLKGIRSSMWASARDIVVATQALPVQWQTCFGCGGTGQLKADDWREGDGAAGWETHLGTF